jgi:LacI family transcriptional regulator
LSEIQRVRIARVQYFLRTTDMKLTAIAEACDFPSSPRLNVLFLQATGQTPGEYRAMFRHE